MQATQGCMSNPTPNSLQVGRLGEEPSDDTETIKLRIFGH